MLSTLSLKSKLIFICLVLSGVSCIIGMTSFLGSRSVSTSYENVSDRALPNLQHLNDMFLYFRDLRINLRTLGLPDLSPVEEEKHIKQAQELIIKFEETEKLYRAVPFTPEQKELHAQLVKEWGDFKQVGAKLLSLQKLGTPEARRGMEKIILIDCPESAAKFTTAIDALKRFHNNEATTFVSSAKTRSQTTNSVILALVVCGIVAGLIIGTIFSNKITRKISAIASQLINSSKQTSITSAGLTTSSVKLSEGSTESAASLEETVSALEELSSQVKLNSEHAKEANSLSQASHKSAEEGKSEISKLINAMKEMTKSSKKIEEIINVIDDIAFQTNLLALNAAVEAARAGEQGKGFAVVADAVRNLAGRSSIAAKDISTLIKENVQMTSDGSKIAGVSGEALIQIVTSVKKVADLNSEIAHASTEQAHGIEQISRAMNLLDSATQSNAVTSQEVSSSAEKMSHESSNLVGLADELSTFIKGGDYKSPPISEAKIISIYDHGEKEKRIEAA